MDTIKRRAHVAGLWNITASIFWGLWLFPFGLLVIRSGFVPLALGWLLFVAAASYLVGVAAWCLLPHMAHATGSVTSILEIGELPIIFWLLIWGARGPLAGAPIAESGAGA